MNHPAYFCFVLYGDVLKLCILLELFWGVMRGYIPPFIPRPIVIWNGVVINTIIFFLQLLQVFDHNSNSIDDDQHQQPTNLSNRITRNKIIIFVFGVLICNYYNVCVGILINYAFPNCNVCKWSVSSLAIMFVIGRVFNYLFFIQVKL